MYHVVIAAAIRQWRRRLVQIELGGRLVCLYNHLSYIHSYHCPNLLIKVMEA